MATEFTSRQCSSSKERWPAMGSNPINMSDTERTLSVVGGVALAMFTLTRMPKTGMLLLAGGLWAVYRGVNGHCHVYEQLGIDHGE
jgi:uncharacterized membrane protein